MNESDRAARVARGLALAERTFPNREKASRWLHRNLGALGGRTPMERSARMPAPVSSRICWRESPGVLLPDDTMLIRYHVPDDLRVEESRLAELPEDWRNDQPLTRRLGSAWLDRAASCLLRVPSVIVPVPESDDRNIIINHHHRDAARIMISRIERFAYDRRLLNSDAPGGKP